MSVLSAKIGGLEVKIAPQAAPGAKICPQCGLEKSLDARLRELRHDAIYRCA